MKAREELYERGKCVICGGVVRSLYALTCSIECKRVEARLFDEALFDLLVRDSHWAADEANIRNSAKSNARKNAKEKAKREAKKARVSV